MDSHLKIAFYRGFVLQCMALPVSGGFAPKLQMREAGLVTPRIFSVEAETFDSAVDAMQAAEAKGRLWIDQMKAGRMEWEPPV